MWWGRRGEWEQVWKDWQVEAGSYFLTDFLSNGERCSKIPKDMNLPVANAIQVLWLKPKGQCDDNRRQGLWKVIM